MPYLNRKKTLMGRRYEVEVPLSQYGGDIVRVHAVPDLELARIEARVGYSLEMAISAMQSAGITQAELEASQAPLSPELTEKIKAAGITPEELEALKIPQTKTRKNRYSDELVKKCKDFSSEEIEQIRAIKPPSPELLEKAGKAIDPKLVLFLGELAKAGIVPDPDCECRGKGCDNCDVKLMVEDFRSYTVQEVGMAVINASTVSWQEVEDFFSRKKAASGAGSSA